MSQNKSLKSRICLLLSYRKTLVKHSLLTKAVVELLLRIEQTLPSLQCLLSLSHLSANGQVLLSTVYNSKPFWGNKGWSFKPEYCTVQVCGTCILITLLTGAVSQTQVGQNKTWTLHCGLDHGLDSGLN